MEFVSKSVHWINGQDIMDTCFVLNYGYEAPLPWPQVLNGKLNPYIDKHINYNKRYVCNWIMQKHAIVSSLFPEAMG